MKCPAYHMAACLMALGLLSGRPLCLAAEVPQQKPAEPQQKTAAPAKPSDAKSLDDELLRELGDEPAAGKAVSSEPPARREHGKTSKAKPPVGERRKAAASPAAKNSSDPLDDDLLKQLEGDDDKQSSGSQTPEGEKAAGDGPGESGPIERLTRQMRDVQQRLERQKTDADTQQLEKKILDELEKMIEQANNQSSSSSSSSKKMPQQGAVRDKPKQSKPSQQAGSGGKPQDSPARDSSQRLGKPKNEKPDMARLQDLMKDIWGELPPRLRQQMMQSSVEHFVPKYEFEIEEYFKTLAERQQEKP